MRRVQVGISLIENRAAIQCDLAAAREWLLGHVEISRIAVTAKVVSYMCSWLQGAQDSQVIDKAVHALQLQILWRISNRTLFKRVGARSQRNEEQIAVVVPIRATRQHRNLRCRGRPLLRGVNAVIRENVPRFDPCHIKPARQRSLCQLRESRTVAAVHKRWMGWGRFLVHQAGVAECGNPVSIEDSTVCPSQILISRSFDNVTSKQIITALKRQLNPRSKCRDSHNTCSLKQSERERRGAVQF